MRRSLSWCVALLGMAASIACGVSTADPASGLAAPATQAISSSGTPQIEVRTLVSSEIERRYLILAPEVDGDPKLPMLIVMHGWSFSPEATVPVGLEPFALANHVILVVPEGIGLSWNAYGCCPPANVTGVDDVQFIADLIEDVAANHRLDRARVYASGISNGGGMAYRLACERPDLIAAIGSIAGGMGEEECAPGRPVPVIEIHGDADWLSPYPEGYGPIFGNYTRGAPGTVVFWAANNGCALETHKQVTFSSTDVLCEQYRACKADAKAELCTVFGGGHNWPGSDFDLYEMDPDVNWWWGYQTDDIDAHEVIWDFVKEYRLP
ncbi:poly(3-hydroxybutyrate) depolymerase-like protein [Anaeromyxobacter dehalogenans 2CP-1]|uniref:Poly(3-hydroxybutyrate) depolymerase-like protein n=1 Tax=Anaeromyxobacter dehalogenans (strain ATCC BAA-258 / DSM 21875 / 2CP-1) TaxID=455488 RepID=B8J5P7_ANAD2|nr:PHB depolymerase family esterase [Anaeromyxobacter dehalogenans]ACL64994.1 poly(3-hydroxybutyrate) depolymerase-like protein [Anaeromyxobacter dehalogenans 2CP-1]